MDQRLSCREAAAILGVLPRRVQQYCSAGLLGTYDKRNQRYWITRSELKRFRRPKVGRPRKMNNEDGEH